MNKESVLLNDIPKDWSVRKIKYIFDERNESNNPVKTDILISLTHDRGVILYSDKGDIGNKSKDDLTKYKLVYPGDIVINSMNVIIGSSGLSNYYGLVSPVYYILKIKEPSHDKIFFHYLFRSLIFQKSLIGVGNGILEHRMRIPIDKLGSQFIPLPSSKEQKIISSYLDKKCKQIDLMIEKIQKKIEFLKEERTTFINQCVTKGLDPDVKMKDSGVAWIGEIPKHWNLKKLKYLVSYNTDTLTEDTDPDYSFNYIEIGDVNHIEGINLKEKIIFNGSPSRARRVAKRNDVIVSTVRTYLRAIGVIPDISDVICSTGFCVMRDRTGMLNQNFLFYSVKSEWFVSNVISNSYGASYPAINSSELVDLKIVLPPLKEQEKIVKKLKTKTENFDNQIKFETKRINLLKEYRQSLISSVVTGKVRIMENMI